MQLRTCCALQAQAEGQKYQIEALTAQLEHLMASKSQLESRCQLLEKVVKMREDPAPSSSQVAAPWLPLPYRPWKAALPPQSACSALMDTGYAVTCGGG